MSKESLTGIFLSALGVDKSCYKNVASGDKITPILSYDGSLQTTGMCSTLISKNDISEPQPVDPVNLVNVLVQLVYSNTNVISPVNKVTAEDISAVGGVLYSDPMSIKLNNLIGKVPTIVKTADFNKLFDESLKNADFPPVLMRVADFINKFNAAFTRVEGVSYKDGQSIKLNNLIGKVPTIITTTNCHDKLPAECRATPECLDCEILHNIEKSYSIKLNRDMSACSGLKSFSECGESQEYIWNRYSESCVVVPTEDECAKHHNNLDCDVGSCNWDSDTGRCVLWSTNLIDYTI